MRFSVLISFAAEFLFHLPKYRRIPSASPEDTDLVAAGHLYQGP
jgi:hypothetical protein